MSPLGRFLVLGPHRFLPAAAVACLMLAGAAAPALGLPAFPGAQGPGSDATGGRGYEVYHVTTLAESGPGSWRDAISQSNRLVVFDVGGTIKITNASQSDHWLRTSVSNITIAGQTAPGDGIFIYGTGSKFTGNNVIIRNLTFRPGTWAPNPDSQTMDSLWLEAQNSIVDHVSAAWHGDEGISTTDIAVNTTVQYSIIEEGLNWQNHSYGGMIDLDTSDTYVSYHHNLFAHNRSRNPRIGNKTNAVNVADFRNNVMYNWGNGDCGYSTGDEEGDVSFIGNYYIAGPNSSDPDEAFHGGQLKTGIYQQGNKIDWDRDGVFDGTDTGWSMFTGTYTLVTTPWTIPLISYTETADEALQTVLNYAGANWTRRDPSVDARVVNEVRTGTGSIPNTLGDVGGYTYYPEVHRPGDFDTDSDGMPNYWEVSYGLDPSVADNNGDFDADGYTNLEEYLNEVAAFPAPKPIVWTGGTGRYELIGNWDIPWQPSRYDAVQINTGKATVAYLGQEAGTMYVGSSAAELAVTGGSLAVANGIYLGNASGSRGTLTATGGSLVAGGQIVVASSAASTGELTITRSAYVQAEGLTASNAGGRYAKINLEISPSGSSLIHATGSSSLGGVVDALWLGANRPKEGDAFKIIDSSDPNATYSGAFDSLLCDEITLGIPSGLDPFGGRARSGDYELFFQGLTYGDASGDHQVGTGDLALMAGSWLAGGKAWANGDFTGDGVVGTGDLALMAGNWLWVMPSPAPDQPIPEPASLSLLFVAAATALTRTKRRQIGRHLCSRSPV